MTRYVAPQYDELLHRTKGHIAMQHKNAYEAPEYRKSQIRIGVTVMNDQIARQSSQLFAATNLTEYSAGLEGLASDGLSRACETLIHLNSVAADNAKALEDLTSVAYRGATSIGEQVWKIAETNAKAAFDVVDAVSRSTSLPEVLNVQTRYIETQVQNAGAQFKELYELSNTVAQQILQTANSAADRGLARVKNL